MNHKRRKVRFIICPSCNRKINLYSHDWVLENANFYHNNKECYKLENNN